MYSSFQQIAYSHSKEGGIPMFRPGKSSLIVTDKMKKSSLNTNTPFRKKYTLTHNLTGVCKPESVSMVTQTQVKSERKCTKLLAIHFI